MDLFSEDSKIAAAEKHEMLEIFKLIDVDGSKELTKDEFICAVQTNSKVARLIAKSRLLSGLVASGEFEKAFSSFDVDGEGTISEEEWWKFCKQEADEEKIREIFNAIDLDGSRYITQSELSEAFKNSKKVLDLCKNSKVFGKLIEQDDWQKVIADMDSNQGDSKIDYPEFWSWCKKIAAKVQIEAVKEKARVRANRVASEREVLYKDYVKRLKLHSFKNGASQGGVFTVSIAPCSMNYPKLPKSSNPFAPPKTMSASGAKTAKQKKEFSNQLRGRSFMV